VGVVVGVELAVVDPPLVGVSSGPASSSPVSKDCSTAALDIFGSDLQ
jgi:hypothetical protein